MAIDYVLHCLPASEEMAGKKLGQEERNRHVSANIAW